MELSKALEEAPFLFQTDMAAAGTGTLTAMVAPGGGSAGATGGVERTPWTTTGDMGTANGAYRFLPSPAPSPSPAAYPTHYAVTAPPTAAAAAAAAAGTMYARPQQIPDGMPGWPGHPLFPAAGTLKKEEGGRVGRQRTLTRFRFVVVLSP